MSQGFAAPQRRRSDQFEVVSPAPGKPTIGQKQMVEVAHELGAGVFVTSDGHVCREKTPATALSAAVTRVGKRGSNRTWPS
ncbi:MAG: hypothetical protein A2848_02530 [Candidatus Magasanikbacteria bacterium RIFCSPHIGHO2_01_FULL_50_8]|uniref:Uncharacterized protein n=1 Tax=Candidatus Magasanikbacteria bacterium RIFCSPHIGHO2_01_FULL_50_8 TaxID=1798674 RepID=A0A1F6LNB4_9BACT|nr:MAG: hypothetical protein A2848_02530 [Candidatus Magasanikbacteria bacterium RIFCSPHIGHO2_01_FULL_50_8]